MAFECHWVTRAAAVLLCSVALCQSVIAAPEPSVQFMATGSNWSDSSFTGHAFVCLQLPTNTGIKEDCYGFYPKSIGAIFGGPGVVDSEFNFSARPPTRFSNVVVSLTKSISLKQRQQILATIAGWDKSFSLTSTNCVSLANAVAGAAGLNRPAGTSFSTPVQYVTKLKEANP
ncbi:hypothetical protein [Candidatus Manganitrophus noduliformans]|uniref:Uncharacterized protein n=1 Tax=Candidatus Manganitrophus noduliformans TaxID=2606439 RepID=A0A7X6IB68_9BACT|nr:hypothetical protein [Candidatus Manganitrophus noduliformans]NKE71318.1 hypothetical protein [Candidatus Manganitrophus noduliformans]